MRKRSAILVIVLFCLGAAFAAAGVIIEQKTHVDPVRMPGRDVPARDYTEKIFLENDRMRWDNTSGKNDSVIVRADEQKVYFINHASRSVMVASLPLRPTPEMERMFVSMRLKCQLQRTGVKKKVGAYNCEEVVLLVSGHINIKMTLWCSAEPPVPFERYYALYALQASCNPAVRDVADQMKALGAVFPVLQVNEGDVMGTPTRVETRLLSVRQDVAIPADQFLPPAGYQTVPFDAAGGGPR